MATKETIQQRFNELANQQVRRRDNDYTNTQDWGNWSAGALNLVQLVFGKDSAHYEQLKTNIGRQDISYYEVYREGLGIFLAAKADFEKDCYVSVERKVSGEVFGDFIVVAKRALDEGNKDVAAVLACAALEDALKRFANANALNVDGKEMSEVIGALKSKGLVSGAQKSILEAMPKVRNAAMHADWAKLSGAEVSSVIGFTEKFLLDNF